MLRFLTRDDLDRYEAVGDLLASLLPDDSPPKRLMAWAVYGGLLHETGRRILDIGCGDSPLTAELARRHDYTGCDLRDGQDWRHHFCRNPDIVIANDLFPNVDQGLDDFLAKYLRAAGEMRLTLTVYADRIYRARRVDGDEVLTVKAWDWDQTARVLERHGIYARHLAPPAESMFPNGRQVAVLAC